MLKVKVLKQQDYKKVPFFIRRIGNVFEYLVVYKDNLYTHYFDIKPQWYRKFLKEPFTKQEIENIIGLAIAGAHTTIKILIKERKKNVSSNNKRNKNRRS